MACDSHHSWLHGCKHLQASSDNLLHQATLAMLKFKQQSLPWHNYKKDIHGLNKV